MSLNLSASDKTALRLQHKRERDKRICDRIKAVLAYADGYSYSEIAEILLLDDETVRRHIRDYFAEKKLSPANGGSESKLDDEQSLES